MDQIMPVMFQLAITSPLILVWIVGIVLAALRLHEPRFRLVLIALILLLVVSLAGNVITLVLPISLQRRSMSVTQIGVVLSTVGIIRVLLESVGWILLLVALFQRTYRAQPIGESKG